VICIHCQWHSTRGTQHSRRICRGTRFPVNVTRLMRRTAASLRALQKVRDHLTIRWTHHPRNLQPIAQQHQRRPQLDPETPAQPPPRTILHFQMFDPRMLVQGMPNFGLRACTDATTGRAELQQGPAGQRGDLSECRLRMKPAVRAHDQGRPAAAAGLCGSMAGGTVSSGVDASMSGSVALADQVCGSDLRRKNRRSSLQTSTTDAREAAV
jgi:hypothetical protein